MDPRIAAPIRSLLLDDLRDVGRFLDMLSDQLGDLDELGHQQAAARGASMRLWSAFHAVERLLKDHQA